MPFLRDISIERKLTFITMLTSCIALLLACAAFVTYEQVNFRRTMARDFSILADMFDDYLAPGCDAGSGAMAGHAARVAKGIREVMAGQSDEFELEYPCQNAKVARWFMVRITRFTTPPGGTKHEAPQRNTSTCRLR